MKYLTHKIALLVITLGLIFPPASWAVRGLVDIDSSGAYTGGGGSLPSGLIAFFAGACPTGWTEYTAARGRVVVGLVAAGTAEGTVGTALTNLQDKSLSLTHAGTAVADHSSHTHTYTDVISHNHTQDAHTHTQNSHNHTQDAHNHTQDSHNHTQNAHSHTVTSVGSAATGGTTNLTGASDTSSTTATAANATATNIAATATNQAATATNQAATATNQNATATNQATGIATGTTAGPSATLTHGVTQPNAHTVNMSDTMAYIQLRACAVN